MEYHEIAPRLFETLKIHLVQGRDFNDADRPGAPRVVIVNETLANGCGRMRAVRASFDRK